MADLKSELAAFPRIDVTANGLRFAVRTAGEGDKLALCLHGFPEAWFSWRHQMPLLAELGYRVWAPDLRGYGDSERPARTRDYAVDRLVDDVAGLIDASGSKDVTLIAHDWGGNLAWELAAQRVRPLSRLVLMNIGHPAVMARALRTSPAQLRRSWYIFAFQIPWLAERWLEADDHAAIAKAFAGMAVDKSRFPAELLDLYRERAARPGAVKAMLAYYRAALRFPSTRRRATIETPTLLVWGEEDTALGIELAEGSAAHVKDFTLERIPRCSHWVQQEQPERVNEILRRWLTTPR
ncbi:MAG: alpha/beta hydrolase [Sandaracinus sp.]